VGVTGLTRPAVFLRVKPDDKIRDMTRSLLPCKARAREAAREAKARVHRHARRETRATLAARDPDADAIGGGDRAHRIAVRRAVADRRDADKVNPFKRWANALTKHSRDDVARYEKIRRLLGRETVITEHALGHFVNLERARNPLLYSGRFHRRRPARPWKDVKTLEAEVLRAIKLDHAGLNHVIRAHAATPRSADDPGVGIVRAHACAARLAAEVWSAGADATITGLVRGFFASLPRSA
jgi:hypothetical protein